MGIYTLLGPVYPDASVTLLFISGSLLSPLKLNISSQTLSQDLLWVAEIRLIVVIIYPLAHVLQSNLTH